MTQTINIYISESGRVDAGSGINASVSQQPSPEDNGFDGVIDDMGVPAPEMFADGVGDAIPFDSADFAPVPEGVGTEMLLSDYNRETDLSAPTPEGDDAAAPFPGEDMGFGPSEMEEIQLPMPTSEPESSASFAGIPEPEDFDESITEEKSTRKTTARKPRKTD